MIGVDFNIGPTNEIVIAGDLRDVDTRKMLTEIQKRFTNKVLLLKSDSSIESVSNYVKDKVSIDGKPTVYICSNFSCKKPTNEINEMLKLLL